MRIGTLNVGTMTGKGIELVDTKERRKVDTLCIQVVRKQGQKHWRWIQAVRPWCREEEKWSGQNLDGRVHE